MDVITLLCLYFS